MPAWPMVVWMTTRSFASDLFKIDDYMARWETREEWDVHERKVVIHSKVLYPDGYGGPTTPEEFGFLSVLIGDADHHFKVADALRSRTRPEGDGGGGGGRLCLRMRCAVSWKRHSSDDILVRVGGGRDTGDGQCLKFRWSFLSAGTSPALVKR